MAADRDQLPTTRLVMISGPIASGKSTVAAAIAAELRREGWTVAVTSLDVIAEMALPSLPNWDWAHSIHAQLVGAWLATDIDVVVDEGSSTPGEVRQLLAQVPVDVGPLHVVLTADYAASLARAQSDPGRGVSKEPDFLRADHDRFDRHRPELSGDLQLDVEGATAAELADRILDRLRRRP